MKLTTALASCVVLLAQQALAMSNVEKEMRAEFTMPYKSGLNCAGNDVGDHHYFKHDAVSTPCLVSGRGRSIHVPLKAETSQKLCLIRYKEGTSGCRKEDYEGAIMPAMGQCIDMPPIGRSYQWGRVPPNTDCGALAGKAQ